MKRIISVLLAFAIICSMGVSAFAASGNKITLSFKDGNFVTTSTATSSISIIGTESKDEVYKFLGSRALNSARISNQDKLDFNPSGDTYIFSDHTPTDLRAGVAFEFTVEAENGSATYNTSLDYRYHQSGGIVGVYMIKKEDAKKLGNDYDIAAESEADKTAGKANAVNAINLLLQTISDDGKSVLEAYKDSGMLALGTVDTYNVDVAPGTDAPAEPLKTITIPNGDYYLIFGYVGQNEKATFGAKSAYAQITGFTLTETASSGTPKNVALLVTATGDGENIDKIGEYTVDIPYGTCEFGKPISLTAPELEGYTFKCWNKNGLFETTDEELTLNMYSNTRAEAVYEKNAGAEETPSRLYQFGASAFGVEKKTNFVTNVTYYGSSSVDNELKYLGSSGMTGVVFQDDTRVNLRKDEDTTFHTQTKPCLAFEVSISDGGYYIPTLTHWLRTSDGAVVGMYMIKKEDAAELGNEYDIAAESATDKTAGAANAVDAIKNFVGMVSSDGMSVRSEHKDSGLIVLGAVDTAVGTGGNNTPMDTTFGAKKIPAGEYYLILALGNGTNTAATYATVCSISLSKVNVAVDFYNANGSYISGTSVTKGTAFSALTKPTDIDLIGYTFDKWLTADAEDGVGSDYEIVKNTTFVAQQTAKEGYGEEITPTPNNNTTHWLRDGKPVFFGKDYTYYRWSANDAITQSGESLEECVVAVIDSKQVDGAYMMEYYVPESCTLLEAGILFDIEGRKPVITSYNSKATSSRSEKHGQFAAKPGDDTHTVVRGYVIYKDSNSDMKILYTE